MAYDDVKVGVEYDGPLRAPPPGWDSGPILRCVSRDIDKQFALTELGWLIIRASIDLLRYRTRHLCRESRDPLHSHGFDL